MKKFLFVVAALATSLTASAQLWVGGSLGFDSNAVKDGDPTTNWLFEPTVGYALNDNLEVGLTLLIEGSKHGDDKNTYIGIAPFARYTFLSAGDFSLFGQASIPYLNTKVGDNSTSRFGVRIQPGVKYALTDQFSMFALLGNGLYFDSYSDGNTKSRFGFDITTGLSLGLVYSF